MGDWSRSCGKLLNKASVFIHSNDAKDIFSCDFNLSLISTSFPIPQRTLRSCPLCSMDVESDGEAQLSRIDNLKTILLRIIGSLGNLENERPEIESSTKAAMESISDLIVLLKEDRRKEECVVFVTFFQMNPIKKSILPLLYKADQEDKCRIVELFFLIGM